MDRATALRALTELPRPDPVGLATHLRALPAATASGGWRSCDEHRLGGILADDMGLGKTLQVLALMQHAVAHGVTDPFLVVAPTSVVTAWRQRGGPPRTRPAGRRGEPPQPTTSPPSPREHDVVVTTYALLRLERSSSPRVHWGGLVLDEAQQVKNHQSKTYAAVRALDADVPAGRDRHAVREPADGAVVAALHHRTRALPAGRGGSATWSWARSRRTATRQPWTGSVDGSGRSCCGAPRSWSPPTCRPSRSRCSRSSSTPAAPQDLRHPPGQGAPEDPRPGRGLRAQPGGDLQRPDHAAPARARPGPGRSRPRRGWARPSSTCSSSTCAEVTAEGPPGAGVQHSSRRSCDGCASDSRPRASRPSTSTAAPATARP